MNNTFERYNSTTLFLRCFYFIYNTGSAMNLSFPFNICRSELSSRSCKCYALPTLHSNGFLALSMSCSAPHTAVLIRVNKHFTKAVLLPREHEKVPAPPQLFHPHPGGAPVTHTCSISLSKSLWNVKMRHRLNFYSYHQTCDYRP